MIALLATVAVAEPRPVDAIPWARPFVLQQPETYTMQAERPQFSDGVLLELRVDPALRVPRQVGVPVLYVGAVPAYTFNWDPVGGCVVAFVPGRVDLATTEVYFGSDTLPERVDAAHGAAELAAARAAGITPRAPTQVEAVLNAVDLREVHEVAMGRVRACSLSPEDHLRQ